MDYNNINKDISNTNRDEITAAVDFTYKTIDTLALYAREKSDSIIDMLSKVSPNEMCNFGIRNGIYMMRLMRLNEQEKEITLNALGTDAVLNGDSSNITGTALSPSYAKGYNYVDKFVNIHKQDISSGIDVTSTKKINNRSEEKRENLYYDDNGTGEFDNKIKSVNLNSILNKTKRLFNQHKINTIISRFHTDSNLTENSMDVRTEYGLSHGRNLLKGDAQRGDSYPQNGYDNPYCRVWTHHYQYDSLDKRMRPFMDNKEDVLAEDFHKWKNFKDNYYVDGYDTTKLPYTPQMTKGYGWKDDTDGWKDSVLGKNGFVNITPKFQGGGEKNIHTKQCMFSIENLAWKDYDPYSFEKALSWEQRGPMGGRIMWFPPYGISFNETTSTNWNSSTFIGRGEDVYTYINTVRTGTLNFMLLVDHPSILDYVSWGGRNNDTITKVSDDDVHRFFAGCDNVAGTGGSNETGGKLSDYAKPTPLTDEYIENRVNKSETPGPKSTPTQSTEPQISMDEDIKVTFYVFFPNNYSGYYDRCDNKYDTNVEAIPYLLYGKGAQMTPDGDKTKNLPLSFENTNGNNGVGYEMQFEINTKYTDNYIIGTDKNWWKNKGNNKTTTYVPSTTKKWYYRIDGKYVMESITSLKPLQYTGDAIINCYDQDPRGGNPSFYDKYCYNLNSNIEAFKDAFNETNNENLYSLSDVAQALASEDIAKVIAGNVKNNDIDRINKLKNFFNSENGYKLKSVDATGYSNEHGKTVNESLKNARNKALAKNRAGTVLNWLKTYLKGDWKGNASVESTSIGHKVNTADKTNVSGKTAKMYRSVKVEMNFKREATNALPDANQQKNSTINTGENLINDIIKEIEEEVIYHHNTTGDNLNAKEREKINTIIDSNIDKLGSNYLEKVQTEIKTELSIINFTEQVDGGNFTLYEDWQYGDDDEDKDDNITALIKEILNMSTVDSKDKMTDDTDFEQKLGILIKEDINKLKDVKDTKKSFEKFYETYHKDDSKIEELNKAIQINNQNIENLTNEITQLQNQIKNEEEAKASLKEKKETIKKDTSLESDEKEHEMNKIQKEIDASEKKINNLTKEKKNKETEKKTLENNNETLEDSIDDIKKDNTGWLYSQKVIINGDDIDNVINDYFKEGNVEIDDFYRKKIVKDISVGIAPKINCVVKHTVNDINVVPNDVIVEITFDSGCYSIFNEAIENRINEGNNTAVNIDKGSLSTKLKELEFVYKGDEKYRNRYDGFNRKNENNTYWLPFVDETINIISDKLSSYSTKVDVLRDIDSIKSLLNEEFKKYLYIYIVSVDNAVIQEKTNKIKEILNKYNENMDKSEYVGFSKHIDENTGETYYINENETDPKKKNLKWVEELGKDNKPTGKLVLKYIDGKDPRAKVIRDAQTGHISNGDNKSRYDQEYYFFRVLKDKDRMTYDKVMEKIQYFDPAFHSMTPEGFSARLNFLNQCMRAGNTVTASDGSYAKSANNLAFGRPPFCVLRLGDWYNQMIVIDNISISYDPLVWDLNEEGIGVIPLIANVSMSFKFIGGGDLGGPVRRLQNAMSFNYYANGRLYDNRSDRMKYNWDDKTCGALKGNEIDTKNSYFYTAQNYKELDTINKTL